MKIKKRDLQKLIENYLYEAGTGDMKGTPDPSRFNSDPDADDFELTDDMLDDDQSAYEEYVAATDAYEYPEKPIGNMPHFNFGDEEGVNYSTKEKHIPSHEDIGHVQRRQAKQIGGPMPSVEDIEKTIPNFGEDEVTKESPFGTQYSLDDTDTLYRYNDKTVEDDGFTAHSDDDIHLGPEDEEGYDASEDYAEDDTLYDVEDESLLSKIRSFFSRNK